MNTLKTKVLYAHQLEEGMDLTLAAGGGHIDKVDIGDRHVWIWVDDRDLRCLSKYALVRIYAT